MLLPLLVVCALSLLTYYVYRIASWYRRIVVIGAQVDKLPGEDRHWFYGHLKNVSLLIKSTESIFKVTKIVKKIPLTFF